MKALILAGGEGKRFGNLTNRKNKCMTVINGKPLIENSLRLAAGLDISEIIILVGHMGEDIMAAYKNEYQGKPLRYAFQQERRGLVHAIECAKDDIGQEDFFLMLGDEIMVGARHEEAVKKYQEEKPFAVCGVMEVDNLDLIRKNYSVTLKDEGIICKVVEKPETPETNIMGTGNCIFKNEILSFIPKVPINPKRGEKELPALIQCAINEGRIVKAQKICDGYINVNFKEDISSAEKSF